MKIATAVSTANNPEEAAREAWSLLLDRLETPSLVVALATVAYDLEALIATLRAVSNGVPIQGGTSCTGVMTDEGFFGGETPALGLLGIADEEGDYGVGVAPLGEDPRAAGAEATRRAMVDAECEGEMPTAIWMITTPGGEEQVVLGIEDVVGPDVPLVGGSAADNTIEGNWRQFSRDGVHENSVAIAALYPSGQVGVAFHSGYDATSRGGTITKASGRTIAEIDDLPAAIVYDGWTDGAIADIVDQGGQLLSRTTLHPLGRPVGEIEGVPYFVLSHPESSNKEGALNLFTDVAVGERVVCMTGSVDNLVERAGHVVRAAQRAGGLDAESTTGGLIIFCGGCFLAVQERIGEVYDKVGEAMGGKPFLTAFTFGEQGRILGVGNRHGNLMISSLLFSPTDA